MTLVPQASEELRCGKQAVALKGDRMGNNGQGDAFELSIKRIPILLDTVRGQDEIVPKHPERYRRILDAQPEVENPLRCRRGPYLERNVSGLRKINPAVGSSAILIQCRNESRTIG